MSSPDPENADPGRLAMLLSVDDDAGGVQWRPEEFAAVWRHQLASPVRVELSVTGQSHSGRSAPPTMPPGLTVGELLHHPSPAADLLDALRELAKSSATESADALPRDVARVLYFATIVAGVLRCGRRLTSLDDDSLRRGIEWSLTQEWLDPPTRQLFSDGHARLTEPGVTRNP